MELRVLRYFLMAAREENITKAAGILHISQPSLSRQLMQLEEELGVKLFHRRNHSITLTDEGFLLKRRAQELVSLAEKTKKEFCKEDQLSGEISIGSGEFNSTGLLSQMMVEFRKLYPLVQFEFYSGNSDNIKERIERGNLDLGLLLEPVEIAKYDFVRMPVKEEWGALVRETSDLAKQSVIKPEDLANLPLLFTGRESIRNELINWFGEYANGLDIAASGNLPYNLAALAQKGAGVFINLRLSCRYEGLSFLPLSPALESGTVLVFRKAQPFSPATETFIRYVKKCINNISDYLI